ncbi:hypothetical protein [Planomicrobium okeanokoites]|uniref:hypothetical protein n=1 Tax=Planomicrobium okeanokoites TaxID=244 RepID=UPI0015C429B3|nr:hypothetical protein [Planomicrobium okeanokoites]
MKQLNLSYYISFNNSSFDEKRKRPLSSDKRKTYQQSGAFYHGSWDGLRLEELAVGVWTPKSANAR